MEARYKMKRPKATMLKIELIERGMTQRQLARSIGVDEATISEVVNGWRVPNEKLRMDIMNFLDCSERIFDQV